MFITWMKIDTAIRMNGGEQRLEIGLYIMAQLRIESNSKSDPDYSFQQERERDQTLQEEETATEWMRFKSLSELLCSSLVPSARLIQSSPVQYQPTSQPTNHPHTENNAKLNCQSGTECASSRE